MGSNELATKESFSTALSTQLDNISDALPSGFNRARFVQNTISLLNDNPDLQKYGKNQLMLGLMKGATLGLDFFAKEAYLIPYGTKLNYQTSYTGSVKLAKKYSIRPIREIYAELYREGDKLEAGVVNGVPTINFTQNVCGDGEIKGAFAVCLFADGGLQYDIMSLKELETTRKHSRASNSPAWKDFTGEMYKKTVLRRLCKHIEIDFENADQARILDDESAIETDPKVVAQQEIEENANAEEFDAEAIDLSEVPLDENGEPLFR